MNLSGEDTFALHFDFTLLVIINGGWQKIRILYTRGKTTKNEFIKTDYRKDRYVHSEKSGLTAIMHKTESCSYVRLTYFAKIFKVNYISSRLRCLCFFFLLCYTVQSSTSQAHVQSVVDFVSIKLSLNKFFFHPRGLHLIYVSPGWY